MQQIKFKTFTEDSIESLEKALMIFLSQMKVVHIAINITIKQIEERKFPNIEEDYNAIVTLVTKE